MPVLFSSVLLVYLVSTSPIVHVRAIDKMTDEQTCQAVIDKVIQEEKDEPEADRVGPRLKCIRVSYSYDADGDGPKKPVNPPAKVDVPHTAYPCRNPITKGVLKCKEAVFLSQ